MVISNTGDAANRADFWLDLYVNPSQKPTANTVWQKIAPAGALWGDQLYVYVDSYHSQNSYGVELESDESDNLAGPVTVTFQTTP